MTETESETGSIIDDDLEECSDCSEKIESADPSSSDRTGTNPPTKEKKKKNPTRKKEKRLLRDVWLRDFSWIVNRENKPFCKICQKILTGGQTHLKRHEQTDYHKKRINATSGIVALNIMARESPILKAALEAKNSALKLAVFITEHNLSFKLLEHLTKLLPSLCPDSEIAKQITCSRTKGRRLAVDVLAPQSLKEISEKLRTAKYSFIIDETTDISTCKCLAMIVRYFDESTNEVRDRCLGLLEVPKSTAAALYTSITEFLAEKNIPLENMIGFAADNASVMMGSLNGVQAKLKEKLKHLFVIGCLCHSFHLCASAACLKLPKTVEDLARDIYSYFSHSSKRLAQFAGCQEIANLTPHRLLRPCQTRWLSLQAVVNRILEQWPALLQFFGIASVEDNLQSATTILNALENPIYKMFFCFLSYALGLVNRLNVEFQSREPLIYSLLDRVTEVFKTLLKNYMKADYVSRTPTHLIDPGNIREYKPIEQLYVGARVEAILQGSKISPGDVKTFKLRVLDFYIELCKEIKRRIKFNDPVLTALSVLNPKIATSGSVGSIIPLAILFPNLIQEEKLEDLNSEWRLLPEVKELSDPKLTFVGFINLLGTIENQAGTLMFPVLHSFIKALACLPHSSAAAERVFSDLNLIKTKTRNKLKVSTCNALLLTKELLHTKACHEWKPDEKLHSKSSTTTNIMDSDSDEAD